MSACNSFLHSPTFRNTQDSEHFFCVTLIFTHGLFDGHHVVILVSLDDAVGAHGHSLRPTVVGEGAGEMGGAGGRGR